MRSSWLMSLVAVGLSLAVSVQAHAQPVFSHTESIEYAVTNADLVVIGKVVEFDREQQIDQFGMRQAAYEILEDWGVDAEKPLIREEVLRPGKAERIRPDQLLQSQWGC